MWNMQSRKRLNTAGLTLLELSMAMAVFSIVLGATAQTLVSYYVALDSQNRRHTAMRNCATVLSNMRTFRDANEEDFPGSLVAQWPAEQPINVVRALPGETITVEYVDVAAVPLAVTVRSRWNDLRGRPMQVSVSTILSNT
jgi:prepilin-type N-terminal cleavage/methylation domain-containing protein